MYLGSFRLEFEKAVVIFEISTLEFFLMQSLNLICKCLNFEQKFLYLGIFGLEL